MFLIDKITLQLSRCYSSNNLNLSTTSGDRWTTTFSRFWNATTFAPNKERCEKQPY